MKFLRQDAHKKTKLGDKWRKPKGWQNKVRLNKKGYRKMPHPGYGTPNADKYKINGEHVTFVSNLKELEAAKGTVLLTKMGMKKKIALIEAGEKLKVKFGFDAKKLLAELKETFSQSKKESEELKQEKEEREKKAAKEEKKESKEEKTATEEKDAAEEKKELDKKLIHTK